MKAESRQGISIGDGWEACFSNGRPNGVPWQTHSLCIGRKAEGEVTGLAGMRFEVADVLGGQVRVVLEHEFLVLGDDFVLLDDDLVVFDQGLVSFEHDLVV